MRFELKPLFKKSSVSFRWLCGFLILFFLWVFLAWFAAENLIVEKPLEHADAILVLGGSSVYIERAQKAAEFI